MPVSSKQISTLSSIAHLISAALESYGVDSIPVFKQAGIELAELNDPEERISSISMQKAWHLAVQATDDPCFGLTVAKNIQPGALHGLGFSWIASDTLRDALERLSRYYRVLVSAGEVILLEQDKYLCLWLKIPPHDGRIAYASLDAALGIFVQMCRLTAGPTFSPHHMELQRQEPPCGDQLLDYFQCPVVFTATENKIYFSKEVLNNRLPTANPVLARANDQVVIDYLSRFDRGDIANKVRANIIELLPSGAPTQEKIASRLHFSVRNLQRKLQAESTSFKKLLDEVRQQLAEQYLLDRHRTIGEITYILGFSEPSGFTRAFKRWAGTSPQAFRASN